MNYIILGFMLAIAIWVLVLIFAGKTESED